MGVFVSVLISAGRPQIPAVGEEEERDGGRCCGALGSTVSVLRVATLVCSFL